MLAPHYKMTRGICCGVVMIQGAFCDHWKGHKRPTLIADAEGLAEGVDTCNRIAFNGIGGPGAGVSCFAADMLPM